MSGHPRRVGQRRGDVRLGDHGHALGQVAVQPAAPDDRVRRLHVEGRDPLQIDEQASYALKGCSQLGRYLPEGVTVVTRSEAGEALADTAGVSPHPAEAHSPGTMVPCPAC